MFDDQFTIETPEQIDVAYDVAGIGARFIAALIDHVLIGLILSLGCAVGSALLDRFINLDDNLLLGLLGIGVYLFLCGYYIFFETIWNGQTPGKRATGLRVVRTGGRPIGFLGSATRNIVRLADFLPVLYGVGVVVMFLDRRSRRLGDLAAGALTIKEQRTLTLETLVEPMKARLTYSSPNTIPNLKELHQSDYKLIQSDYELIQDYLGQRLTMSLEARRRLSGQLVQGMQQRLGYPIYGDTESFLLRLVAEYNGIKGEPVVPDVLGSPLPSPPNAVAIAGPEMAGPPSQQNEAEPRAGETP